MSEGAPKDVTKTGEEPTKTFEINGKKFELGPNLGEHRWDEMNQELVELNKTLKEGEKPWRLITKDEYEELGRPVRQIWSMGELLEPEKRAKISEYLNTLGLSPEKHYWANTNDDQREGAFGWYAHSGKTEYYGKNSLLSVQTVREV